MLQSRRVQFTCILVAGLAALARADSNNSPQVSSGGVATSQLVLTVGAFAPGFSSGSGTIMAAGPIPCWTVASSGIIPGDINGDGRMDVVNSRGWWEQPAGGAASGLWRFHPAQFGNGGAEMGVYDVNGDGLANDRAFVADPARAGDPASGAGMRALLASSSSSVRDCLTRQLGRPVATLILPRAPFYVAEDYHQDYYTKNPYRYRFYRWNCGRDQRLEQLWGEHH